MSLKKYCTQWRRQTNRQTDKQTNGNGDSMTELAQWGRLSESCSFGAFDQYYKISLKKIGSHI